MLELSKHQPKATYEDMEIRLRIVTMLDADITRTMLDLLNDGQNIEEHEIFRLAIALDIIASIRGDGFLEDDLLTSAIPMKTLWQKMEPMIKEARRKFGLPGLFQTFESIKDSLP